MYYYQLYSSFGRHQSVLLYLMMMMMMMSTSSPAGVQVRPLLGERPGENHVLPARPQAALLLHAIWFWRDQVSRQVLRRLRDQAVPQPHAALLRHGAAGPCHQGPSSGPVQGRPGHPAAHLRRGLQIQAEVGQLAVLVHSVYI